MALFDGFAIAMFHRLVLVLCLGAKRVTRGRWEGFEDFGLADRVSLSLLTIEFLHDLAVATHRAVQAL